MASVEMSDIKKVIDTVLNNYYWRFFHQRSAETGSAAPGGGGWRGRLGYMMGIMTIEPMMFVQVTKLYPK